MFNVPALNKQELTNEDTLDVELLPDMDSDDTQFVDFIQEQKEADKVNAVHTIPLPKEEIKIKDLQYLQDGATINLRFKLTADDVKRVGKLSYGLFTTDISEGTYQFQIKESKDGVKELYYYDEFVGEMVDGRPKIYRRYYMAAVIRSMVKQDILIEYEQNRFTINPVFFLKLELNQAHVAEALMKKGFPIVDEAEMKQMRERQQKVDDFKADYEKKHPETSKK